MSERKVVNCVELKLEKSVGVEYSSIQLKLESIKEVISEVRERFIESICWSELISQPVDQLDLIKWSWMWCDKVSELGVYSWAVKQSNRGTVTKVESDLVTTVILDDNYVNRR
jgi:hypothetical protein